MVNSGLSMLRCLYVLEEQTPNTKLAKIIGEVRGDVEAGIALSDALEKHPKVFSRLYVSMVRAGELGGILDEVLNRLATQLEKDDSIRRAVKSAMVYPMLIGVVRHHRAHRHGACSSSRSSPACTASSATPSCPMLTRIMVGISNTMRSWRGLIVLVVIIFIVWGLRRLKQTDRGHAAWDRFKLHVPMGIGEIIRKLAVARFSRTLGTLVIVRRAHPAGHRHHRQGGRQRRDRTGHGRRAGERQGRPVHHRRPCRRSRCSRPWSRR